MAAQVAAVVHLHQISLELDCLVKVMMVALLVVAEVLVVASILSTPMAVQVALAW
jgi:hypothetical protein